MAFFDFLSEVPYEASWSKSATTHDNNYSDKSIKRLNLRWDHVIKPFVSEITHSKVLDLASHDGRFPYAFSGAGAKKVIGVEYRADVLSRFKEYPDGEIKDRVELHADDMFDFLGNLVSNNETYDVVGMLGIFYHIMGHYQLLKLVHALKPKLIIIDSEFMTQPWPYIAMIKEKTNADPNTIAHVVGQKIAPIGIVSIKSLEMMAESLGYKVEMISWEDVDQKDRSTVSDYFRPGNKRRFTYALRPL